MSWRCGKLAFELHHPSESLQAFGVKGTVAGFEHADAVDERGDLGAGAATGVLAEGAETQVVVAARAPGTGTIRNSRRASSS